MDVLLWLGWFFAIVVTVFTIWMLTAGAVCARSPSWDARMYAAGVDELHARGFQTPVRTTAESQTIIEVLGSEPLAVDPATDSRLIDAIRALTDATENDIARLSQIRAELLGGAVAKQHAAVERVATPWLFAKVWNLRRGLSSCYSAAVGLRWFVPLFAARTRRIGEKCLSTAALLGIWAGLLFWGFAQLYGRGTSGSWLAIVSVIITLAGASGLVVAVGRQMYAVAAAWWGLPSQWTRKGVLSGTVIGLVVLSIFVLAGTGTLQRASAAGGRWLVNKVEEFSSTDTAGAILMVALLLFLIRRSVRSARTTHLQASERVAYGFAGLFLASLTVLLLAFIFQAPRPLVTASVYASGAVAVGLVAYQTVIFMIHWQRDLRFLKHKGVYVPRRGFRPWALVGWLTVLVAVMVASSFTQMLGPSWQTSLIGQGTGILLMVLSVVTTLTFLPGVVVTGLYIWKVKRFAMVTRHRRQALEKSSSRIGSSRSAASADEPIEPSGNSLTHGPGAGTP